MGATFGRSSDPTVNLLEPGKRIQAMKNVTGNEIQFPRAFSRARCIEDAQGLGHVARIRVVTRSDEYQIYIVVVNDLGRT